MENACIAAGGNGRSCSQIVRNARSSAKASRPGSPSRKITHSSFPSGFPSRARHPPVERDPPFLRAKPFSKRRKYEEDAYGLSIDRSIDRSVSLTHARRLRRYAGYETRRVCVCMMLQV